MDKIFITVEANINAPVEQVWEKWTNPKDIINWNNTSDDWHTTKAENNLKIGGKFLSTMAAKDGSFSFDFEGTYNNVVENKLIEYNIIGGREVKIMFSPEGNQTKIVEIFEAENENSVELQQAGWKAILNNFKKYVENK